MGPDPLICYCLKRLWPLETWMILFVLFRVSLLWLTLISKSDSRLSYVMSLVNMSCYLCFTVLSMQYTYLPSRIQFHTSRDKHFWSSILAIADCPICFTFWIFFLQSHSNFMVINLLFNNENQVKTRRSTPFRISHRTTWLVLGICIRLSLLGIYV